jgi:hypothetical protein
MNYKSRMESSVPFQLKIPHQIEVMNDVDEVRKVD